MKKVLNFLLISVMLLPFGFAAAQQIPIDPDIRIGKLDNGLTYYIKHNAKPEKKVELRLAINAGSILEDDDQQGLAHFMEHMNFNGTKNFPDNQLVDYLQSIGVRFGADLNAYTGFDQTVFMLPVPLDKPENLKTGMKVIEDWAFNALLTDEQIDKERGVVLEELRMGLGANMRMFKTILPITLKGSRYADRLPIGQKEILESFPYDALRRFHRDWYRPNLMAVLVVGDINVDEIEKMIKENFSKYQNPKNPRERVVYDVPNHKETYFAQATDKEATYSMADINFAETGEPKIQKTVEDYKDWLVDNLLFTVVNNRLQELADSPNPPFTYGYIEKGDLFGFTRTKEGLSGTAVTAEGKQLDGLKVVLQEIERAKQFGVTQSELDRAKNEMISQMEKSYNEREKTESSDYVDEYIRNFLQQEPIPGITWEYNLYKTFLPTVTLEQVNAVLPKYVRDDNQVISVMGPQKEGITMPSENEFLSTLANVKNEKLTPYEDKVAITQLVTNLPKAGKISKIESDSKLGTTTWTLSNGAKVVLKKTDFKNDEIRFAAMRKGGRSLLSDADYRATQWAYQVLDEAGLNGYTKTDVSKYLAGKQVNVSPFVGNTQEGLNGSTTPKDLPTLMELTYAYFTGLNYDEPSYNSAVQKMSAIYDNLLSNPQYYFFSEMYKYISKNDPRFTNIIPTSAEWKNQDFKKAHQFYKDRVANAGDFTFYFVGNIDEQQLKPLVEQYIATLPANKTTETYRDNGYRQIYQGKFDVEKGQDPKSFIMVIYQGDVKQYDQIEAANMEALSEVVDIKMTEILREQESGVYSAGTNGSIEKTPYPSYNFSIFIPTGPVQAQKMLDAALGIVKNVIDNGPDQKDVDKYREEALNKLRDDMKTNQKWMSALRAYNLNGVNKYFILDEENVIKNITVQSIQAVAKKYLTDDHRFVATLMPEEGWQEKAAANSVPAQATDVSAQSVIDNYINALGGKTKLESVKTLLTEGTTSMMGMELATTVKQMYPNKQHSEMIIMGQKIITNFDGKKGYVDQMGQRTDFSAEDIEEYSKNQMFDALALDATKIKSVELQTIDGKECYVLTDDSGKKNYFDKTTWLLYRTEGEEGTNTIKSYGEFGSIMFPTEMVQVAQGMEGTMKVTKVTINQGVTEKDFQ